MNKAPFVFVVLLVSACATTSDENLPSDHGDTTVAEIEEIPLAELIDAGVERLNELRVFAELDSVENDVDLAAGCLAHIRYMAAHKKVIHDENTQSEWYTPEGKMAGANANVAGPVKNLVEAVDFWMASPYHRLPMLHPGLTKVGAALESGYACVDLHSSVNEIDTFSPVPYPGDQQVNVPMGFSSYGSLSPVPEEYSEPTGFIVSLTFPVKDLVALDFTATLTNKNTGSAVESFVRLPFDPNDPYAEFQQNSVLLIPKQPLATGTQYEVKMKGLINDLEIEKLWSFTTANPLRPLESPL